MIDLSDWISNVCYEVDDKGVVRVGHDTDLHDLGASVRFTDRGALDGWERAVRYGLLARADANSPFAPVEHTVTTKSVPVPDSLAHCGKFVNPIYWPRYVTGVAVDILRKDVETDTIWKGAVRETLDFGPLGVIKCELEIAFEQSPTSARAAFKLIRSYGSDGKPVLDVNEGFVEAKRKSDPVLGEYTSLSVKKTFQINREARQAALGALAPALMQAYLERILVEFALRYSVRDRQGPPLGHGADEVLHLRLLTAATHVQGEHLYTYTGELPR